MLSEVKKLTLETPAIFPRRASNRSAIRDRMTLEHTASEADKEDRQNRELLQGNKELLERVAALEQRILQLESNILGRLDAGPKSS